MFGYRSMTIKFRGILAALALLLLFGSTVPAASGYDPQAVQAITFTRQGLADTSPISMPGATCFPLMVWGRRAFHYAGRPYDFDFDFLTDSALVCTELVSKAYEWDGELPGLDLPTVEVPGRQVTPANLIARQFDEDYGGAHQQFDLVAFLDGHEAAGNAIPAGLDTFRHSWRRPKWYVLVQNTPLSGE
jgi:hypothetical protein